MKKILLIAITLLSVSAFAGKGHSHSHGGHSHSHGEKKISKVKTIEIGKKEIKRLIKLKKLDSSWSSAVHVDSVKKKFSGKTEWVVTFTNEKGVKGKKLYVFLKLSGKFIAANFTGN